VRSPQIAVPRHLALLLFLATASSVLARQELPFGPAQPIILRLEGHFAPDREHARTEGADAVLVRVDDVERWFAAVRSRTLGDHPLDGRNVLAALAPFGSELTAVGATELRRRLHEAPIDTPVALEGLVDRGSRTLLLRDVVVGAPP
jgi:hypothetical protein